MKLSQFKPERKMIFKDGKVITQESTLNGEVNFAPINKKIISKIGEEVIDKLIGDEGEEKVSYLLIPYLTDIEVDVDFDEFFDMIEDASNEPLTAIFEGILGVIEGIFNTAEKRESMNKRNKVIEGKFPEFKDHKETLNELYESLSREKDEAKKDVIMKKIIQMKKNLQ